MAAMPAVQPEPQEEEHNDDGGRQRTSERDPRLPRRISRELDSVARTVCWLNRRRGGWYYPQELGRSGRLKRMRRRWQYSHRLRPAWRHREHRSCWRMFETVGQDAAPTAPPTGPAVSLIIYRKEVSTRPLVGDAQAPPAIWYQLQRRDAFPERHNWG
eukprot:1576253-Prymnesium_polylepis.1